MKSIFKNMTLVKAVVVAALAMLVASLGLDIPRDTIEEAVNEQFDKVEQTATDTTLTDETYRVVSVIDGDTIVVRGPNGEDTVRLIGIDTPEVAGSPAGAECYGAEASTFARGLMSGAEVRLATDDTQAERDRHDRLLAYVTLSDGRDVGEVLIGEGYAYEYTYAAAYVNQNRYQSAEADAKQNEAGVWGVCNTT